MIGARTIRVTNILYARAGGTPLYLDVIRPVREGICPVVLTAFGGGWCSGERSTLGVAAHYLAQSGYVVCNADYRLAPAHPFPAALDDLRAAAAWIGAHAADYGGDAARLGAYGVSAGGHLLALLATTPASPLACAVSWAGPMDLRDDTETADYRAYLLAFLGDCPHRVPQRYALASPLCQLTPASPPLLLLHGSADTTVAFAASQRMAQRALAIGASLELQVVAGVGHIPGNPRTAPMQPAWQQITDFLARHCMDSTVWKPPTGALRVEI
jgi:acetyl esterase/lipase